MPDDANKKPTPKGRIDSRFETRINDLAEKARTISKNLQTPSEPRMWHTPSDMTNNLMDVPNLHEPCWNRDPLNSLYCDVVLSLDRGGVVSDLIGLKRQINFMAVEERAWRLRHATKSRCMVVAHGRLHGHGVERNVFTMMKNEIENIFLRGQQPPQS